MKLLVIRPVKAREYYSYLDILIERTNLIAAPSDKQIDP